jgi:predicted component of type VI protein secretion system
MRYAAATLKDQSTAAAGIVRAMAEADYAEQLATWAFQAEKVTAPTTGPQPLESLDDALGRGATDGGHVTAFQSRQTRLRVGSVGSQADLELVRDGVLRLGQG